MRALFSSLLSGSVFGGAAAARGAARIPSLTGEAPAAWPNIPVAAPVDPNAGVVFAAPKVGAVDPKALWPNILRELVSHN